MVNNDRIPRLFVFVMVGFLPAMCVYLTPVFGYLVNFFLLFNNPQPPTDELPYSAFYYLILAVGLGLLLFLVIAGAYWLFERARSWIARAAVMYAAWLLLAGLPVYLMAASFAGASMAVVEAAAAPEAVRFSSLVETARLLLFAQICILPWAGLAAWAIPLITDIAYPRNTSASSHPSQAT